MQWPPPAASNNSETQRNDGGGPVTPQAPSERGVPSTGSGKRSASARDSSRTGSSGQESRKPAEKRAREEDSSSRPEPKSPSKKPRYANAMLRMTKHVYLPQQFVEHLQRYGHDFSAFFTDRAKQWPIVACARNSKRNRHTLLLLACLDSGEGVDMTTELNKVRMAFLSLFVFDLLQDLNARKGTTYTGRRMGPKQYEIVTEALRPGFMDVPSSQRVEEQKLEAKRKVTEWMRMGKKLNQWCDEFGEGCLFYLTEFLVPDL